MTHVAMATAEVAPKTGLVSRRTDAMPKTSLFGSALEIQDEEKASSIRSFDPTKVKLPRTPPAKGKGQQFELPEEVKRGLPRKYLL